MDSRSVYQAFAKTAEHSGDKPFLQLVQDTAERYDDSVRIISYAQADITVRRLCGCYCSLGLRVGSRVALALDNRPDAFFHWFALNALGVSVVPLNPQWRAAELEYVLNHSEARFVICLPDRKSALTQMSTALESAVTILSVEEVSGLTASPFSAPAGGLSDECALLYTSGTTGKPKGCMLSNEYFLVSGDWYRNLGGLCSLTEGQERLITPLPMYHMNAMATSTMGMLMAAGCIIPLDRFHPSTFWQSVTESRATILHYLGVMPAILMKLPERPEERTHHIRFGFGAGLGGDLHGKFEQRFGFKLIEAWAMTETGCAVAVIANKEPRHIGTACFGRPPEHLDYRIVDDQNQDVERGKPGELLVRRRGKNPRYAFFSGYLKDSETTDLAWQGGFFHTGDLVMQGDDDSLHFVDRKKNIIRRSGENISAVEVEEVLLEHPAVLATGVTAVPDDLRGDEVFACIVTDTSDASWEITSEEIVQHCLNRLAYYKAPGYIGRVDALPLTSTEKIQRTELKALATTLVADGGCVDLRSMKSGTSRG